MVWPIRLVRSTGSVRNSRGRAKTRRSWTTPLRPSRRVMMSPITARSRDSAGMRDEMTCKAPRMPAIGFLTSCATAAISPRRANAACSCRRYSESLRPVIS